MLLSKVGPGEARCIWSAGMVYYSAIYVYSDVFYKSFFLFFLKMTVGSMFCALSLSQKKKKAYLLLIFILFLF